MPRLSAVGISGIHAGEDVKMDRVKIDRSFTAGCCRGGKRASAEMLRYLGCSKLQGYRIRPMPAEWAARLGLRVPGRRSKGAP